MQTSTAMLKPFLFAFSLLITYVVTGQDFREVSFGMTPEEVESVERLPFVTKEMSEDDKWLVHVYGPENLFGNQFGIFYTFNENRKLTHAGYILDEENPGRIVVDRLYSKIKEIVIEKYGKPVISNEEEILKQTTWVHPNDGVIVITHGQNKIMLMYTSRKYLTEASRKPNRF